MLTRQAIIIATIRTAIPGAVGWLLAMLIARIPAVADVIATVDVVLAASAPGVPGLTVAALLNAALVGLAVAAYYWLARELGRRWPIVERFLLGSAQQPIYATRGSDGIWNITGMPDPSTSTREQWQAARERLEKEEGA
ncbi:MAG: hypothetical protein FJW64_10990 [Actinobacteria bacterium]|nr:hypothetical protein [Actinomycetota bacterium]